MDKTIRLSWLRAATAIAILPVLSAAPGVKKIPPVRSAEDRIEVVGRLVLKPGEPAVCLLTASHRRHHYLYLEHGSHRPVTIVDVTDPHAPKATGELAPLPDGAAPHVDHLEGTTALLTGTHPTSPAQAPETVTIMSFADPAHPKVVRQFSHVACLLKDPARHLVYLVDGEGLWVLQTIPAADREREDQYQREILYNH